MKKIFSIVVALMSMLAAHAQTDPNFHIYLCLGQSNMEGNARIEPIDSVGLPDRFLMMATTDYQEQERTTGGWYPAVPPLVRAHTGLGPVDWFGRSMADKMPASEKIGVIVVAIGGCRIEHLDKDFDPASLADEPDWLKSSVKAFGDHPYNRMLECAKKAQQSGVIKGILLHQGESNTGDPEWPAKVNKLYNDLLTDLGLSAADVPLVAGEVVTAEQGGKCGSMNSIINSLPQTIPTAYVVSSENLTQNGDGLHFTAQSYRELGARYANAMVAALKGASASK